MSISKTSSVSEVFPNQTFDYVLSLTNNSDTDAVAISTTDQLPSNFVVTSVSLRIGSGSTMILDGTDYTLSSSNLLPIPSLTGPIVSVPAGGASVITISGYFS